jgi:16S rRNA (guanine527-N7)-methyltransferase
VSAVNIRQRLASGAATLGLNLSEKALLQFETLVSELQRWGKRINLTSVLESDEIVKTHLLDSLAAAPHLVGDQILDIGTGAGFPGLPLAIINPQRQFTLLDGNGKKINFVNHMIATLGLSNAIAIKARAEDYAPANPFDTVIARALATVPRLVEISAHLVREDGQLLALKGKHPAAELEDLTASPEWEYSVSKLTVPFLEAHARHVVSLRRK